MLCHDIRDIFISTHSLTRRLTISTNSGKKRKTYFNSQPHKEADSEKHHEPV